MQLERARLSSVTGEAGFSSKTAFRGPLEAAITRWVPSADDPDASREIVAAREFTKIALRHGLSVPEIFRVELAGSAAVFLTFSVAVLPQGYELVGVIAVHDLVEPRFIPRTGARDHDAVVEFTIEASRATSGAQGGWIGLLAMPAGTTETALGERVEQDLVRTAAATLGEVVAPGSESREAARPTRGRPQMEERTGEYAAPPPPPPQYVPKASPPPYASRPIPAEPPSPMATPRRSRSRGRAPSEASAGRPKEPAELRVSRRPEIAFKASVVAGETHPLVLQLHEESILESITNAFAVVIGKGKESVQLLVSLSAPGFLVEPREQPITIGRKYNAARERVTFKLTAQEPADGKPVKRDIRVDIWSGNASIGGVTYLTTVKPAAWTGAVERAGQSRAVSFQTAQSSRDCELVIRVEGKDDHGSPPFQVSLRSRIPGEPEVESMRVGTISFTRTELASYLNDQFASFAERFPADGDAAALTQWRADLLDEVDTLGKWLWTQLPDEFRAEYFRLHDAKHLPASILVHSDEMLIPWELIVPHRGGKVLPRLGVAHVMGRWRPALGMRPRPQSFTVKAATIANPRYQDAGFLVWSLLEAADLRQAVPAFSSMPSVDRAAMKKLLDRTDIQLLHFTGHGKYAKHADLSTLILENGDTITAMHFVGSKLLEQGHPIVYLNACEVGTSGVTMGQMGGFAAQCVEGGCSGIVAPYWAVADDSAREFAVAFYGQLKAGKAIGEALQALRKSRPKDPTYQAFAYLGDPWTQARFA